MDLPTTARGSFYAPLIRRSSNVWKKFERGTKLWGSGTVDNSTFKSAGTTAVEFDVKLVEQGYYHGLLSREDVLYLLQKDGDFLVRITEYRMSREYVLTATIGRAAACLTVDESTVQSDRFGTLKIRIKRPVNLASWEFRTDGFLLGESIGKAGCIEVRKGLIQKEDQKIEASVTTVVGRSVEAKVTKNELMRQCRMLRDLHHPCLVRFYGVCLISQPCCFLMEYLSGDVTHYE
ncbi:hypothetical protein OSTOST_16706 [Ostertagia ostertagi]